MAAITSDPSCFELSDDGTNEPESDVSCTSAAVVADHRSVPFFYPVRVCTAGLCVLTLCAYAQQGYALGRVRLYICIFTSNKNISKK